MRVKICGITNEADAVSAAAAGADAVGINLVGGPRKVDLGRAERIVTALGPMVTPVVLVRLEAGRLEAGESEWLESRRISHLQVYGDVSAESIGTLVGAGFRPIVVVKVRSAGFADEAGKLLNRCGSKYPAAVLLDAFSPDKVGGTGRTFEWEWVDKAREKGLLEGWPPIIVAGGLRSENVGEAVRRTRPYGVDVAGGVESSPGRKDAGMMRAFVLAARAASEENT